MNNTVINYVSALPGSGKTLAMFKYFRDNPTEKYLYVTPLLTELIRLSDDVPELNFISPDNEEHKTKSSHLQELINKGSNICITHKLFGELTKEHLYSISKQGYTVILDEELGFIEPYTGLNKEDISSLFDKGFLREDQLDFGRVSWYDWDIADGHTYNRVKNLANTGCLFVSKSRKDVLIVQLPLDLIKASKKFIVLTYGYVGSLMDTFLTMRGFSKREWSEIDLSVIKEKSTSGVSLAKSLIEIVDSQSSLKLKKTKGMSLSHSYYGCITPKDKKIIFNAIRSIIMKYKPEHSKVMFTLRKSVAESLTQREFCTSLVKFDSYVYASCRATNDYADRNFVVHAYNRFPNLTLKIYCMEYGVEPNQDNFALYEMIQFIYRSSIRKQQPIKLCFLSKRMQDLFTDWLNFLQP